MNREENADDQQFLDRLAAYDEVLAAGDTPPPDLSTDDSPQVTRRLRNAQACLRRLEKDRWRTLTSPDEMLQGDDDRPVVFNSQGALTQLGRFRVIRELGRGGAGIVYLAVDPLLRRNVALKVPRLDALGTPELRRRFLREAQAAAGLDHPNIVPIHEVGEIGPFCYLVSTYCPGPSLASWLKQQREPVSPQVAAELVTTLAVAVHYVHSQGILHRDLKPANILLVSGGAVSGEWSGDRPPTTHYSPLTSHQPKITDFGLAKWTEGQADTKTGTVVGTPFYMAPEQAEGRQRDIGPATDVYALGVILYEMLTGKTPFQGEPDLNVLKQVVGQEPAPPRTRRPELPRDLEAVCLKCLEKEPRQRYATAAALAEDLHRFLAGDSTTARPAGPMRRLGRQVRRHRAALAGAVLLLAGMLGVWGGWRWYENEAARERLQNERDFRRQQYIPSLLMAQRARKAGDVERARELLDGLRPRPGEGDRRGFEWYHLWQLCQARPFPDLTAHQGRVQALAVSPDGKTLASGGEDQTIKLWDVATGQLRTTLRGHTVPIHGLSFSPRGDLLASCGHRDFRPPGEVKLWDLTAGKERATLVEGGRPGIGGLAFSPDGKTLAVGGGERDPGKGIVQLWDACTGRFRRDLHGFPGTWVHSVAFAPDGRTLAAGGESFEIQLWDPETGQARASLKGHTNQVSSVKFSPDGKTLASGSYDGTVRLWDTTTFEGRDSWKAGMGPVLAVAFAPDGKSLAGGGDASLLKLWDVGTGRARATLKAHDRDIRSIAFAPDGRTVFAGTGAGVICRWWDPAEGSARAALKGHTAEAWAVAFAPDGRTFATSGDDHLVRLWDAATGREMTTLQGHTCLVSSVAFAPDGKLLASGDYDGVVRLWETGTGRERTRLEGHRRMVRCLAFAPDGRTLATAGHDFTVRLWDVATGTELARLEGHRNNPRSLAFAPDGRTLASSSEDHTVRLWDVASRQTRLEWTDTDELWCLAFSPDGGTLATGNSQGVIRLWDAATGAERASLRGHVQGVKAVAFTPDGRRLASGSDDKTVKLWDVERGQELLSLSGHEHWVNGVAFAPDGHTLASVSHDGAVKLWLAARDEPLPQNR
jgi:WD40 repeat protein